MRCNCLSYLVLSLSLSCNNTDETESNEEILARMTQVGQNSIRTLLRVDPTIMHEAWTDSMLQYSDETCPPMEEHNGMDLWRESCSTTSGNQFLGWALNLRIDQIYEDGYNWDVQDWLSGQARIISPNAELSNYGDILHKSGTNPSGKRAVHGMVFGNFAWTDLKATGTWLEEQLNIEYNYAFDESPSGGWSSTVDAWLSNYDDSMHGEAVIWEAIEFDEERCNQEPIDGLLWLREGEGRWITVSFDETCDGCGRITGSNKQLCLDFSMWFDWESYPWDVRASTALNAIENGGEPE